MLIDVSNPKTFPCHLRSIVYEFISSLPQEIKEDIRDRTVLNSKEAQLAIENYMAPGKADTLFNDIIRELSEHSMICYHATRIIDDQSIFKNGLYTNDWDRYCKLLKDAFKLIGINEVDAMDACGIIEKNYNRKFVSTTPQICFFSPLKLLNANKGNERYDQFCESIGGELARDSLEDNMPEVYQRLKMSGKGCVIKIALPFIDMINAYQEKVAFQFISYYSAEFFWNFECEIEYDCVCEKDVTPDQILEVIPCISE